jgi:hypothetical protein
MTVEEPRFEPPDRSAGDLVHAGVKAALGSIPLLGAAAAELFALVVAPPLEKRRNEWMRSVGEALSRAHAEKAIDLEQAEKSDSFVDTALQASQIALRNHQEEKLQALRNAVVNAAAPEAPAVSLQQFFLRLVDEFTVWHLRLLRLFQGPEAWFAEHGVSWPNLHMGGLSHVVETAFPELRGRRDLYDQFWRDLYLRGMVSTEHLHTTMTGGGLASKRTTDLADQFLRFITNRV